METIPRGVGSLQISEDDVLSNGLDFFAPSSREVSMVEQVIIPYKPNHLDNDGPYTFNINPPAGHFTDLSATRMLLKVKVKTSSNGDLPETTMICPVNSFGTSFIDHIDVTLDGNIVPELGNSHFYFKAYCESVLSYSKGSSETHLKCQGFFPDKENEFETFTESTKSDTIKNGLSQKKTLISGSKPFTTVSPLFSDLFQSDRYFPPGFLLGVNIYKSSNNLLLLCNESISDSDTTKKSFTIHVEELMLLVTHIRLNDSITTNLINKVKSQTMLFPFTKNIIKRVTSGSGTKDFFIPNFVQGSLPRSIILFFSDNKALDNIEKNPFDFKHYDLNYALLRVNGTSIPSLPYQPEWTNATGYIREYREFHDNIGISHDDHSTIITPEKYAGGYFFLAFDLSPDKCNGIHKHYHKTGVIDVDLRFLKDISSPIVVNGLLSYDALLTIKPNKEFNVVY
jgi:hypothetical protein